MCVYACASKRVRQAHEGLPEVRLWWNSCRQWQESDETVGHSSLCSTLHPRVCMCTCVCVSCTGLAIFNSNENHLVHLKNLWQTHVSLKTPSADLVPVTKFGIPFHISHLFSLSLLVLGMLLWFSIRPPILTSGGLDKQETHWAHQLIGQTKGRLKPIIDLIYNEVNQSDHKGRRQHNHSERRTTQCGAHLSWSEKGTLKVSCTFCSWWKTEDYSVQVCI